jgi:NADPH-dependent 2,4-dienoyl-CoA reductase/sulfur reductase-like enzyme
MVFGAGTCEVALARAAGMDGQRRVVVIGGGFGGLRAVVKLSRAGVQVTLLDRRNYHLFQPLLHQVATGALSSANIARLFGTFSVGTRMSACFLPKR